jgi:hypothetical protein
MEGRGGEGRRGNRGIRERDDSGMIVAALMPYIA